MIYTTAKKFLYILILWLFTFSFISTTISAYNPTPTDTQQLNNLKTQLNIIISWNNQDLRNFFYQIKNLQQKFSDDPRLDYMLNDLKQDLYNKLYTQKTLAKIQSQLIKQQFVEQFAPNISIDTNIPNSCTWRYNTLDDISFAYNFPTALTTAIRYRESTCAYYLPNNKNWPFQIISKDYGTWQITEDKFVETITDFMDFTKHKINRYERVNNNPEYKINLYYTWFDLTWVVRFWALYNSLSWWTVYGDIKPRTPWYVFDWYWEEYSWARRYGILPKFIKILDRELQNKY